MKFIIYPSEFHPGKAICAVVSYEDFLKVALELIDGGHEVWTPDTDNRKIMKRLYRGEMK